VEEKFVPDYGSLDTPSYTPTPPAITQPNPQTSNNIPAIAEAVEEVAAPEVPQANQHVFNPLIYRPTPFLSVLSDKKP
jgi:hypothetical protein